MPGHIKLGHGGDLRDYAIADMNQYARTPANQMAAKLSTGGGNYDDLQNWSYFVMEDWRAGLGKKDPEAGGFLYSELETRYSSRLTLPTACNVVETTGASYALDTGWRPGADIYPDSTVTIGATQTIHKLAKRLIVPDLSALLHVELLLDSSNTNAIDVELYTESGGAPGTFQDSVRIYPSGDLGWGMYYAVLDNSSNAPGDYVYITIAPAEADETITLPVKASAASIDGFKSYNGSAWSAYTVAGFLHGVYFSFVSLDSVRDIVYFPANGKLYVATGATLYTKESDAARWEEVEIFDGHITDLLVVGDEIWAAQGDVGGYYVVSSDDVVSTAAVSADLLMLTGGRVWRTLGENAYYTSDGVTWDGPVAVTQTGYSIRAISFIDEMIYCATDDGLYKIGYGDIVYPICTWPSIDSNNGKGMINHQGSLFIPVQQSVFRYDGQNMLPVGFDLDEGLPANRVGIVTGLKTMNNWLIATVTAYNYAATPDYDPEQIGAFSTVYAYNDQGWHFVARLPYTVTPSGAMCYDVTTRRLYVGSDSGAVWMVPMLDSANFNNTASYAMPKTPMGALYTDWFNGGLLEVFKDCESIYVTGDGFDSNHYAQIYWQDDDSTDWELLGTVTTNRAEVRWSDYDTRPNTRQLKILIALFTRDDTPPVVRAIRLKYHPMVSDWYRWTFPVIAADYKQLPGGERSPFSREEMEEHLRSLITSVPPFLLEDIDGILYEVKVTGCPVQILDYQYLNDGPKWDALYNFALEQIRPDAYEA